MQRACRSVKRQPLRQRRNMVLERLTGWIPKQMGGHGETEWGIFCGEKKAGLLERKVFLKAFEG